MQLFQLCQIILHVLVTSLVVSSGARDPVIASPAVRTDTSSAQIWKCSTPNRETLHELLSNGHQLALEVISVHSHTVHVLSSTHNPASLQHAGLSGCTPLASPRDLFRNELAQNWHKLQENLGEWVRSALVEDLLLQGQTPRVVRRSVGNRECVLTGKCDGQEDHWFTEYHNVTEIYAWFEQLAAERPSHVTLHPSIGRTHYHRDILAVHVTDKSEPAEKKLRVYFQCLLHPREWISGPVCMYIARYFANPEPGNEEMVQLLKKMEFIIVPVSNPDGYHITWVDYPKYRFWRKNLVPTTNPACDGVDLNRNFDTHWSMVGSSDDPCSEIYHGEKAGSEVEVQAIMRYIQANAPIVAAIDFHSYYQEMLFPPAWAHRDASNVDSLDYISQAMAHAASQGGTRYSAHSMHSIYLAAGSFPDWMLEHGVRGAEPRCVPLPFTVELRPQATDDDADYTGFMVPTEQILATCEEIMPAVMTFTHLVIDKHSSC